MHVTKLQFTTRLKVLKPSKIRNSKLKIITVSKYQNCLIQFPRSFVKVKTKCILLSPLRKRPRRKETTNAY